MVRNGLREDLLLYAPEPVALEWARQGHVPSNNVAREEASPSMRVISALVDTQDPASMLESLDPYINDVEWINDRYHKTDQRVERNRLAGLEHAPLDLARADLEEWNEESHSRTAIGLHPVFGKVTFAQAAELLPDNGRVGEYFNRAVDSAWMKTMESKDPKVILESLKAVYYVQDLRIAISHLSDGKVVRDTSGSLRTKIFQVLCSKLNEHAVRAPEGINGRFKSLLHRLWPARARRHPLPEDLEGPLSSFLTHVRVDEGAWKDFMKASRNLKVDLTDVMPAPRHQAEGVAQARTGVSDFEDVSDLPQWLVDLDRNGPGPDTTVEDVNRILHAAKRETDPVHYRQADGVIARYLARVSQVLDPASVDGPVTALFHENVARVLVSMAARGSETVNWKTLEAILPLEALWLVIDYLSYYGVSPRYDKVKLQLWRQTNNVQVKKDLLNDISFAIDEPEFRDHVNEWMADHVLDGSLESTFGWTCEPEKLVDLLDDLGPELQEMVSHQIHQHPDLDGRSLEKLHAKGMLEVRHEFTRRFPKTISRILTMELGGETGDIHKWSLVADLYDNWVGATLRELLDTVKAATTD